MEGTRTRKGFKDEIAPFFSIMFFDFFLHNKPRGNDPGTAGF